MQDPRAGEALRRFRRLALTTALVTFVLVVVGGIVRVSESGLGCGPSGSGLHGWPLCGGQVFPIIGNEALFVEFAHRFLAGVVVLLIAVMIWLAFRDLRSLRWPVRGSVAVGVLVLCQAALGGLTVEFNLDEALVAAHLFLAMICFALLIWLTVAAREAGGSVEGKAPRAPLTKLKPFVFTAAGLLLAAMVAGAYMAGTKKLGADGAFTPGAHMACGNQFPGCIDQGLFPFGLNSLIDIHLTHRVLVYSATLAIITLIVAAWRRGSRSRLLPLAGALLVTQIVLGGLNVWLGENAALIAAHLTTAVLLWASVILIGYTQAFAPATSSVAVKRPSTKTVTA